MNSKELIRTTQSICHLCQMEIKAEVVRSGGRVFLEKRCPKHGEFKLLLSDVADKYCDFERFCLPFVCQGKGTKEVEIVVTFKCNMDCPICYWGEYRKAHLDFSPAITEIEEFIKKNKQKTWRFVLTGGEPTLREDLFEIIRVLKKYKKDVILTTNGIKLADLGYLTRLKQAGVDRINMQFDGFDAQQDIRFRGQNYIPNKIKALENLRKLAIPTGINATFWPESNEKSISKLLAFASKNKFIKSIGWTTLAYSGGARDYPLDKYILSDQVLDVISEQTAGKISKANVLIFRKLFLALAVIFNKEWCRYAYPFILFRDKDNYQPIDNYINLEKIDPYLDRFFYLCTRGKLLGYSFFLTVMPLVIIINTRSFSIIKQLLFRAFAWYILKKHYLNPLDLLYLKVDSRCDTYNLDTVSKKCCFNMLIQDKVRLYLDTSRGISLKVSGLGLKDGW